MIRSFRNKELQNRWEGRRSRIVARLHKRIVRHLDALDAASAGGDLNLPGFDFHGLQGFDPKRYSVHVNGPWAITFEFENNDAHRVDLEQYQWKDSQ